MKGVDCRGAVGRAEVFASFCQSAPYGGCMRYESKGRFKVDVENYMGGLEANYPMKHLKIFTESPCQIDLWLDKEDVKMFMKALQYDMLRKEKL